MYIYIYTHMYIYIVIGIQLLPHKLLVVSLWGLETMDIALSNRSILGSGSQGRERWVFSDPWAIGWWETGFSLGTLDVLCTFCALALVVGRPWAIAAKQSWWRRLETVGWVLHWGISDKQGFLF
jgi:hypothetical protein